jgi:hypothetical protein
MHPVSQIWPVGLRDHMKMVPHYNEAQNRRLKTFRRLAEQFEEPIAIRLVTENRLARVASRAKMVDGSKPERFRFLNAE